MKIKVIIPNSGMSRKTLDEREIMLRGYAAADTEIWRALSHPMTRCWRGLIFCEK